jgi:hypothetical protein
LELVRVLEPVPALELEPVPALAPQSVMETALAREQESS